MVASVVSEPTSGHHSAWVYASDDEYAEGVTEYLAAGAAAGEKLVYVAPSGREEQVLDWLAEAGFDPASLVSEGRLAVWSTEAAYMPDGDFDPDARVAEYERVARRAVEDGFAGLRVAADATIVLEHPCASDAFCGYELRADLLSRRAPFSALCAYDARLCSDRSLASVRAVHSHHFGPARLAPSFGLHAGGEAVVLAGEVDVSVAEDVRALLIGAASDLRGLPLDVSRLAFVDVAGMRALSQAAAAIAAASGDALRLTGASEHLRRIWSLAGFDGGSELVLEAVPEESPA